MKDLTTIESFGSIDADNDSILFEVFEEHGGIGDVLYISILGSLSDQINHLKNNLKYVKTGAFLDLKPPFEPQNKGFKKY